jgi:uncharacterized protein
MRSIELLDHSLVPSIVERCRQQLMMHYRDRLKSIVLYGSAARQEMTDESDIEKLNVEFRRKLAIRNTCLDRFSGISLQIV